MQQRWTKFAVIVVGVVVFVLFQNFDSLNTVQSRSFYMGFTSSPWDVSTSTDPTVQYQENTKMFEYLFTFLKQHSDIVLHHLEQGVPWPSLVSNLNICSNYGKGEISYDINCAQKIMTDDMKAYWEQVKSRTQAAGLKTYLAITPLDVNRKQIAPPWNSPANDQTCISLFGSVCSTVPFNSETLKKVYKIYTKIAWDYFQPDYMAIGVEENILLTIDATYPPKPNGFCALSDPIFNALLFKWNAYKQLRIETYQDLKNHIALRRIQDNKLPNTKVFGSIQYSHFRGTNPFKKFPDCQMREIQKLMPYNDLIGWSVYPYAPHEDDSTLIKYGDSPTTPKLPKSLKKEYFAEMENFGKNYPDKKMAIAESGVPSQSFQALNLDNISRSYSYNDSVQRQYYKQFLKIAERNSLEFVINFMPIDNNLVVDKVFPADMKILGGTFMYTGFQNSAKSDKPVLQIWTKYFNAPRYP